MSENHAYIMYLRKSRADNPSETVEEVLAKHYTILQEYFEKEHGFRIPEEDIYREVVSGESIRDRVEIKEVLSRIEDPEVKGIVVIEPQRLSRGDLVDCGTLINSLQYTHTLVVTPSMTYDMANKMERRFFQDELLRGRDYLEYVKEILMRGKLASVNRGCYLQAVPPFGYDKVRIGKDVTLTPNDQADIVRMIFQDFAGGMSSWEISRKLKSLGVKSPTGLDTWATSTIDKILRNKHYLGKITYQKDKTTMTVLDGSAVSRRIRQDEGDYICVDGKHPPIIETDLFDRVQEKLSQRPPVQHDKVLRNAFAGILYCANCGKMMVYKDKDGSRAYLTCKTPKCSKSIKYEAMEDMIRNVLRHSELPELIARYHNGDGDSVEIQKKLIRDLEKELVVLKHQEETQYEMLETRVYSAEVFKERNAILRDRMLFLQHRISDARKTLPAAIDYPERISTMTAAIRSLKDDSVSPEDKNALLRAIIQRIDCRVRPDQKYGEYGVDLEITLLL